MIAHLVFLLEGETEREVLTSLLPRVLPKGIETHFMVFEGKRDLEKNVVPKLRGWRKANSQFVVLRDQDRGDCKVIKRGLLNLCVQADRPKAIVRILCKELETCFIGDWQAVAKAYNNSALADLQRKAKYRKPDLLSNPSAELRQALQTYQKRDGARRIAPHLDLDNNRSDSFNALLYSLRDIATTA